VAVAEAEDGEAQVEDAVSKEGRVLHPYARGAPREDDAPDAHDAAQPFDLAPGGLAGKDLGVDAHLPDPAGDEVAVLAAEV
jgi:hypothetical protein